MGLASKLRPDIVVLDFSMPGINGLEATRRIHRLLPRTEVLILTMYDSDRLASEFLAASARGYVLKAEAGQYVVEAVERVAQHKPYLTEKVSDQVLARLMGDRAPGGVPPRFY